MYAYSQVIVFQIQSGNTNIGSYFLQYTIIGIQDIVARIMRQPKFNTRLLLSHPLELPHNLYIVVGCCYSINIV